MALVSFVFVLLLFACSVQARVMDAAFDLWVESPNVKIRQEEPAPEKPRLDIRLAGARRETVAFQVALRAGVHVEGLSAEFLPLDGPRGQIHPNRGRAWVQHYVKTHEGILPDPLSPLKVINLTAHQTLPLLFEIAIPEDAQAGEYRGRLRFTQKGRPIGHLSVTLAVRDFEIPVTPSLRSAVGIYYDHIPPFEQVLPGGSSHQKHKKAYYSLLLEHRLSAYHLPVDIKSGEAASYFNDPRMTSYIIPYSDDTEFLRSITGYLKEGGWLEKGMFYAVDEPVTREQYNRLAEVAQKIRSVEPEAKIVTPYHTKPDFEEEDTAVFRLLDGHTNVWCPISSFYHTELLAEKQKRGDEVWTYVCIGPGKPYTNLMIEFSSMQHRLLFWQIWKYKADGFLYWASNYWKNNEEGTTDPWQDMATVKWINPNAHGDGSLVYPGARVRHYGPLPSLRLKLIHYALQDYEYIQMASAKAGRQKAEAVVGSLVTSWTEYSQNPEDLEKAREQLARLITGESSD
mgnify:CR=1 FL=1